MPLQFNPKTGEIIYEEKVIGAYQCRDGKGHVRLNIEYECTPDEWILPISWLGHGLAMLEKHKVASEPLLTIENNEDDIEETYSVKITLTEKTIRTAGYIWQFHKNDADTWPSRLHAHDYDLHLKLDAITGLIYDVGTKNVYKKLKKKTLSHIHNELHNAKDFSEIAKELIPKTSS